MLDDSDPSHPDRDELKAELKDLDVDSTPPIVRRTRSTPRRLQRKDGSPTNNGNTLRARMQAHQRRLLLRNGAALDDSSSGDGSIDLSSEEEHEHEPTLSTRTRRRHAVVLIDDDDDPVPPTPRRLSASDASDGRSMDEFIVHEV